MKVAWAGRRPIAGPGLFLAGVVLLGGCGSESTDIVGADSPIGVTATPTLTPAPPNAVRSDPAAKEDQVYGAWLRSDYVKKVNLKSLRKVDQQADAPFGPPSFEEAVDAADIVVAGKVKDLTPVPYGTLTTFVVDRTAKGEPKQEICIMQRGYLYPTGNFEDKDSPPRLLYDDAQSFLFKGDRAVLLLKKLDSPGDQRQVEFLGDSLGGKPVYYILRGSGQYKNEGGKMRTEKLESPVSRTPESYQSNDGVSEDELMKKAEARTGKK